MSKQLNLFPPPEPKPVKTNWRQKENRHAIKFCNKRSYKPGTAKKIILEMLETETWTGVISIFNKVNMSVQLTLILLNTLKKMALIEETPLYYMNGYRDKDRTIKPPPQAYRGFENGYRLKTN
jgi:hypothetical protein